MPNKNKDIQKETYRKWFSKHKNDPEVILKRKARDLARWSGGLKRKKCSVSGCLDMGERHHPDYEDPKSFTWLCKKHHEQIHTKECSVVGCTGRHLARGYCNKHYKSERKKVDKEYAERVRSYKR